MRFLSIIATVSSFLPSCHSSPKNQPNSINSLEYFKKGSDRMMNGLRTAFTDPDSSKYYYLQARDLFLAAYRADSSLMEVAIYLPDVYFKLGKPDSAEYWQKRVDPDSKTGQ